MRSPLRHSQAPTRAIAPSVPAQPVVGASAADSGNKVGESPLLGRKSVLMGMLTSGFVLANAAQPSTAGAGTVKPSTIVATQPAYTLKWTPSTVYKVGQQVVSPNNDVVSASVAHTSAVSYSTDVAKWTLSCTYASLGMSNAFSLKQIVPSLQLSTNADAMTLSDTLGTAGSRRVSIQPLNASASTKSAQIELVPGSLNDSTTTVPSQILLFSRTGTNYERFCLTCYGDTFLIESNYNGAGTARNIYVQMGGSDSNSIAGQNAAVFYNDASVDLLGGTFVADGQTWGSLRTRIADPGNTGDCRLVIDTRTQTPTDNAADSSVIDYRRGGTTKWHAGLNYAGSNTDGFQFVSGQGAKTVLDLGGGATPKIGFLGAAPVGRAAAIASPPAPSATYVQAEMAAMKTALDAALRTLKNLGLTT